jgi:aryl-alcohol dehydrogenase-like predicted oxidoreductase
MLLVFGAILLLWGGMALLARSTAPRPRPAELEDLEEERRRTAAASAALAWLRGRERRVFPLPPTAFVSAWQAVMRAAQLRQRGPVR